jgi:hypothetical protein
MAKEWGDWKNAGVEVITDVLEKECKEPEQTFFFRL